MTDAAIRRDTWLPKGGETPREALGRLCTVVRDRLGADRVGVWLHDPEGQLVVPYVFVDDEGSLAGREPDGDPRYRSLPVEALPLVAELLRTGEPVSVPDVHADDRVPDPVVELYGIEAFDVIPLRSGSSTAFLTIEPTTSVDLRILDDVLPYLSATAAHASSWREAEHRRRRTDLLLELIEVASGDGTLDDVLATLCQRLAAQLRVRRASVFLVRDGRVIPRMSRYADGQVDQTLWSEFRDPAEPSELLEHIITTGETITIEDARASRQDRWWTERFGIVSLVAAPMGSPPDVAGVIVVDSDHPRRFSPEHVRFTSALGTHVAGVVRRARDDEQRELNLRASEAVERLLEEGTRASTIREAAQILARVAHETLRTEHAVAYLRDASGNIVDALTIGVPEEYEDLIRAHVVGRVGPVAATLDRLDGTDAILVDDARHSDLVDTELVHRLHVRSFALIPLLVGDRSIGIIECGTSRSYRRWTEADEFLLRRLADEGALVLENAALRETEQRRLADLSHRAFHDALTGLPNRALLLDRIEHALARSERDPETVAVLFVDLDRLKTVNDRLGHDAGDQLLVEVAGRLVDSVRPADTVARLAGDEFVVVLEEITDRDEALRVADRINKALKEPFIVSGHEVRISGSVGIVLGSPENRDAEELVQRADLAMYQAKREGGGRLELFDPAGDAAPLHAAMLEHDLRRALQEGGLELRYQPVVDLSDERVVGVEVLGRWRHPRLGVLGARDFIPLAEEFGLIAEYGAWMLRTAMSEVVSWNGAAGKVDVAVNVSARQLYEPSTVRTVSDALEATGLPGHRLLVEVTETAAVEDLDVAASRLAQLKELGVRVALDDFGTGHSSLRALQRLPVDVLKIDRSFVDGVATEVGDAALVRAILDVGASLGLVVIAEGVETRQQLAKLRELGCQRGQGFLFGHPMHGDEFQRFARRRSASS